MSDLIERQAAIEAFEESYLYYDEYDDARVHNALDAVFEKIKELPSAQEEPLPLGNEYVGAHCIKVCPVCYTPWTVPRTSEYLKKAKYPCCPCGQRIKWGDKDE